MDRRITLVINLNTLFFFFFNDTATTEIYTLSLHDALPISFLVHARQESGVPAQAVGPGPVPLVPGRLRHLHGDPPRRGPRAADGDAWLRRRSDDRAGRLSHRLHLGPRRRPGDLFLAARWHGREAPDGGRR